MRMTTGQDGEPVGSRSLYGLISDSNDLQMPARTPTRSPEGRNATGQCDKAESEHGSITDTILARRKQMSKESLPRYSPTPTKSRTDGQNRLAQRQRTEKRHQRATEKRGGLENMEQFVMNGEQLEELQRLSLQAQENTMTPDFAQLLEQEAQEDLEDDELIDLIDRREQLDQELDSILSELSIS